MSTPLNSMLATPGPDAREETGRDRSRLNAVRHGLAGVGGIVAGSDPALEARYEAWSREIRPGTDTGRWALRQAVAETFRTEACWKALAEAETRSRARASSPEAWDLDRQAAAAKLAEGLARRPEKVAPQLEQTRQGAEILLGLWKRLGTALDGGEGWDEAQVSLAHDLLGVSHDCREALSPIRPRRGLGVIDQQRALVLEQKKRLARRIENVLAPLDELDRDHAARGVSFLVSREAGLILRYERDSDRRFDRYLKVARASRNETEPTAAPAARTSPTASRTFEPIVEAPIPEPIPTPTPTPVVPPAPSRAERRRLGRPATSFHPASNARPLVGIDPARVRLTQLMR